MRKILLVLCLLILSGGVVAETNPQLDSIRVAAFQQIGVPAAGSDRITVAIANQVINYGIQQVSTDFPAVEKLDTISMDTVSEGGALSSDFVAIDWCELMIGDTIRIPLEYKHPDSLFTKRPSSNDAKAKVDDLTDPRYYSTKAGRLLVWPKFRQGDIGLTASFLVGYYAVGDALSSGTDETNIHSEYRDELLNWICYRLEYTQYRYQAGDRYLALYDKAKQEIGFKK